MKFTKQELRNENFGLDVSDYTAYIENKGEIVADIFAGSPTIAGIVPSTGHKAGTTATLNQLDTGLVWQAGNCVSTVSGDTTLSPRTVSVARITDFGDICVKELDSVLPMIMRAGANSNEDLPFSQLFIQTKLNKNSSELEKLLWQGDSASGVGNMSLTDGIYKIADGETSDLGYYSTFGGLTGTSAEIVTIVRNFVAERSEAIREAENVKIWMSNTDKEKLANALIDVYGIAGTGIFTNTGENTGNFNWIGTDIEIVGTPGGNGSLFMTVHDNIRYATDLENDMEDVDMWYEKKDDSLYHRLSFAVGFTYDYPSQVFYLKKA